jgi:replication factor C subunit 2/4
MQTWVEKYRPQSLDDVIGNDDIVEKLKSQVVASLPDLLLAGPLGCGKTSILESLAKTYLGEHCGNACIQVDAVAPNHGGQEVEDYIQAKIKSFAQQQLCSLPDHMMKMIIIDHVDNLSIAEQRSLRSTMEQYRDSTRFVLACCNIEEVIDEIQYRCVVVHLEEISNSVMEKVLRKMFEKEQAPFDQPGIDALIFLAKGDLRRAIVLAQSTLLASGKISNEHVYKMSGQPSPVKAELVLKACSRKDWAAAYVSVEELFSQGYTTTDILSMLADVANIIEVSDQVKVEWLKETGVTRMRLSRYGVTSGGSELLELSRMISKFIVAAS